MTVLGISDISWLDTANAIQGLLVAWHIMYDDWFACKMPSHDKHVYNTKNVSTILSIQSIHAKRFLVPLPLANKTRTSYQPPYHFLIEASWIFHARFWAKNSRKKVKSMDKKYLFLRKDGLCKSYRFIKVSASWQSISKYIYFPTMNLCTTKFWKTRI